MNELETEILDGIGENIEIDSIEAKQNQRDSRKAYAESGNKSASAIEYDVKNDVPEASVPVQTESTYVQCLEEALETIVKSEESPEKLMGFFRRAYAATVKSVGLTSAYESALKSASKNSKFVRKVLDNRQREVETSKSKLENDVDSLSEEVAELREQKSDYRRECLKNETIAVHLTGKMESLYDSVSELENDLEVAERHGDVDLSKRIADEIEDVRSDIESSELRQNSCVQDIRGKIANCQYIDAFMIDKQRKASALKQDVAALTNVGIWLENTSNIFDHAVKMSKSGDYTKIQATVETSKDQIDALMNLKFKAGKASRVVEDYSPAFRSYASRLGGPKEFSSLRGRLDARSDDLSEVKKEMRSYFQTGSR